MRRKGFADNSLFICDVRRVVNPSPEKEITFASERFGHIVRNMTLVTLSAWKMVIAVVGPFKLEQLNTSTFPWKRFGSIVN